MQRASLIYKITPREAWLAAERRGVFEGAPIDLADGYIHFSTAEQAQETANKHFAGQDDLILVAVLVEKLGANLKWEVSRGGALFPHLYGSLSLDKVVWVKPMPLGEDGIHILPVDEQ